MAVRPPSPPCTQSHVHVPTRLPLVARKSSPGCACRRASPAGHPASLPCSADERDPPP
jgi:hypothetical protein